MPGKHIPDFHSLDDRELLVKIATTIDFVSEDVGELKDRIKQLEKDKITSESWRVVKQDIADLRNVDENPIITIIRSTTSDHEKRLRSIERFVYYFLGITTTIMASIKIIEVILKLYQSAIKP